MSIRLSRHRSAYPPLLICMGVLAALVLFSSVILDILLLPGDSALGRDFSAFYAAGLTIVYGHTMDTQQPLLSSVAGIYLSFVGRPWSNYLSNLSIGLWLVFAIMLVRQIKSSATEVSLLRSIAIALTAWLLMTPYAHPADLVLTVVALPVVVGRRLEGLADPLVRLALGALLTAPAADLLGFRPNYVFTYSTLVPLTLFLALRPWQQWRKEYAHIAYTPTRNL